MSNFKLVTMVMVKVTFTYILYERILFLVINSVCSPRHICDKYLNNKTENARTISNKTHLRYQKKKKKRQKTKKNSLTTINLVYLYMI